jgi:hypothetical protein
MVHTIRNNASSKALAAAFIDNFSALRDSGVLLDVEVDELEIKTVLDCLSNSRDGTIQATTSSENSSRVTSSVQPSPFQNVSQGVNQDPLDLSSDMFEFESGPYEQIDPFSVSDCLDAFDDHSIPDAHTIMSGHSLTTWPASSWDALGQTL